MTSKISNLSGHGDDQPQLTLQELPATEMPDNSRNALLTEILTSPLFRNGHLAARAGSRLFGEHKFPLKDTADRLASTCRLVQKGNLAEQKSILACQATALDALFTEMAERALNHFDQCPDAADRYMRLALKAQSSCRSTIETLDKMARQGTQTIKHIHVDNRGGRTVITDVVSTGGG